MPWIDEKILESEIKIKELKKDLKVQVGLRIQKEDYEQLSKSANEFMSKEIIKRFIAYVFG